MQINRTIDRVWARDQKFSCDIYKTPLNFMMMSFLMIKLDWILRKPKYKNRISLSVMYRIMYCTFEQSDNSNSSSAWFEKVNSFYPFFAIFSIDMGDLSVRWPMQQKFGDRALKLSHGTRCLTC